MKDLDQVKQDFLATTTTRTQYRKTEIEPYSIQINSKLGYYTNLMNLLYLSAKALPAGFTYRALPCWISLFTRAFNEEYLL